MRFLRCLLTWLFIFIPAYFIGYVAIAVALWTPWGGATLWIGNYKYPRPIKHGSVLNPNSRWEQWVFYAVRNPISNFSRDVLGQVPPPYLIDQKIIGSLYWKYGWKQDGTFVCRPWKHRT